MKVTLLLFSLLCMLSATALGQTDAEEREWMELDNWTGGSTELRIIRLKKFIKKYPQNPHGAQARKDVLYLETEYAGTIFNKAFKSNNPEILQDAIDKYPSHSLAGKAKAQLKKLDQAAWASVNPNDSLSVYRYMQQFPRGIFYSRAQTIYTSKYEDQAPVALPQINNTKDVMKMSIIELHAFIKQHPNSLHTPKAKEILTKRENVYYLHAIKLKSNFFEFDKAVKKFNSLFPNGTNAELLNRELAIRTTAHRENMNRLDYIRWNEMDKTKPGTLQLFLDDFPDSKYARQCLDLLKALDDKYYKVASRSKALPDIDKYLQLFPDGRYKRHIEEIRKDITENTGYAALKKAMDEGNLDKFDIKQLDKNDVGLLSTLEKVSSYAADILFQVSFGEGYGYKIQLINYEDPSLEVYDPFGTLVLDTSDLKTEGIIMTDLSDKRDAYLLVKDTDGRSRKIKLEEKISASFILKDNLITLSIVGDWPPYIIDYYNVDLRHTQKTSENIQPDSRGIFLISTDTLLDLAGNYNINIHNLDVGQQIALSGLVLEDRTNRGFYFALFSVSVLTAIVVVVMIYIKRSKQKTVFDEF